MKPTILNEWILLTEKNNGLDVLRKFAGIHADVDVNNVVTNCTINYWQKELYPNGEVNKIELKSYTLENLAETVNDIESWKMNELNVLNGFLNSLGYNGIINPSRETLENVGILPVNSPNNYPLHSETRTKEQL
jgi:hypothetical protein